MSSWIEREMAEYRAVNAQKEQQDYLVNYSNYWAELIRQLERDVAVINELPEFQNVLAGGQLKFVSYGSKYEVRMTTTPKVFISIQNGGKTVKVRTIIHRIDGNDDSGEKIFKVVANDGYIYLRLNDDSFLVPEQASGAILAPILKELKDGAF